MRLFFGTFLDRDLIANIPFQEIQNLFGESLKPVKKENIHITWIFLGEVEAPLITSLQEIVDKNIHSFEGFQFTSKSLELWPPKKNPRLIVLTGRLNQELNLKDISKDLSAICKPDIKENFLPHITVARFKKDKTVNKRTELPVGKEFIWKINEICLLHSLSTNEGASYQVIKKWDLMP